MSQQRSSSCSPVFVSWRASNRPLQSSVPTPWAASGTVRFGSVRSTCVCRHRARGALSVPIYPLAMDLLFMLLDAACSFERSARRRRQNYTNHFDVHNSSIRKVRCGGGWWAGCFAYFFLLTFLPCCMSHFVLCAFVLHCAADQTKALIEAMKALLRGLSLHQPVQSHKHVRAAQGRGLFFFP